MEMIHPQAKAYAEHFSSIEPDLLKDISDHTRARHGHAHLMSDAVQGKFLEMISCLMQPRRVLEIGSFVGYSSLCLAAGLAPGGLLHTIEIREADAATARENFRRANMEDKIILHVGDARQIIPTLEENWDLVFLDADKTSYVEYYSLVMPRLRSGGLLMADNVLFHGAVLEEMVKGKNARAIQTFNDMVKNDTTVEKLMLTVRDGLYLIRKK